VSHTSTPPPCLGFPMLFTNTYSQLRVDNIYFQPFQPTRLLPGLRLFMCRHLLDPFKKDYLFYLFGMTRLLCAQSCRMVLHSNVWFIDRWPGLKPKLIYIYILIYLMKGSTDRERTLQITMVLIRMRGWPVDSAKRFWGAIHALSY